jgi:hypothetical protein
MVIVDGLYFVTSCVYLLPFVAVVPYNLMFVNFSVVLWEIFDICDIDQETVW